MIDDHLSRLENLTVEERRTKIEENFLDEELLSNISLITLVC